MNAKMCSVPLSSNSELITQHFFEWRRGWAFEVARAETALAPTEGASPLVHSPRRGHIPRDPPVRIPPSDYSCLSTLLPLTLHVFIWRRGWDSNPRSHCWDACFPSMSIRPLSHLSAPIFARRHLNMRSDDRQGEGTASQSDAWPTVTMVESVPNYTG